MTMSPMTIAANAKTDAESALAVLRTAAILTLELLADLTTEQFALGADRPARIALAKALGRDPADYSL